jgi:hypothetical protein
MGLGVALPPLVKKIVRFKKNFLPVISKKRKTKFSAFCTSPPVIEHARHNGPLDQKTFDLDFSLQYQCLPGYITKGFARTKCFLYNGTAKWFGPDITCERELFFYVSVGRCGEKYFKVVLQQRAVGTQQIF